MTIRRNTSNTPKSNKYNKWNIIVYTYFHCTVNKHPLFMFPPPPPMMFEKPWVILNLLAHQESAEIKDGACTFSDVSGMP